MKPYPLYETREVSQLGDVVKYRKKHTPEKDVFRIRIDKDNYKAISWGQFANDAECLGTALIERGLGNAHICVLGENSYEWILAYFAVIMAGGVIVPLDKELSQEKIAQLVDFSDSKAVFFSKTYKEKIKVAENTFKDVEYFCKKSGEGYVDIYELIEEGKALRAKGDTRFEEVPADVEKLTALYFTSGTSGDQKGVMLSEKNIVASFDTSCKNVLFTEDDVMLSVLPLHHSFESNTGVIAIMHSGGVICFNENLKVFSSNLKLFKPTGLCVVPMIADTLYKQIMDTANKKGLLKKLKMGMKISGFLQKFNIDVTEKLFGEVHEALGGKLRKGFIGGAPVNVEITKAFRQLGIVFLQGYGITECSPIVASNRAGYYKDDSVGIPIIACKVRIKDGEVQIKGDNVMMGYYKNEEVTRETMDGEWFKSGDLGNIDDDGFLYITGRKKNLIILDSGENISPEELEGYVQDHELVSEVVVYQQGNKIIAEVFPDTERAKENGISDIKAELQTHITEISKNLPRYKHIHEIKLRDTEFEKTTSKKIKRHTVATGA